MKRSIDIFSPLILFPVGYITVNLILADSISLFTIGAILVFFSFYYSGSFLFLIIKNKNVRESINLATQLDFDAKFSVFKIAIIYIISFSFVLLLIVIYQKIPNKEVFRMTYSNFIPGGNKATPFLNYFLLLFYLLSSFKGIYSNEKKIYFILSSLFILLLMFLTGSRSNIALFGFVPLFIAYYRRKINNKTILVFFILGIITFVGIRIYTIINSPYLAYYLNNDILVVDNPLQTLSNFLTSQFKEIGYRTDKILSSVPVHFPHLYGRSMFFEFYSLLPGEQINPAIELNHKLFHSSTSNVQIPPTLVAEFFLDFGLVGIIIGGFLTGYIYTRLHLNLKNTPSFISFFSFLIFSYFLFLTIYGRFQIFYIILFMVTNYIFYKSKIKSRKI